MVGQVSWTWKGNHACCGALASFQSKSNGHKIGTRCLEGSMPFCQICSRDIISGPPSLTSISVASDKASKSSLSKSPSKVALAAAASWRYMGDLNMPLVQWDYFATQSPFQNLKSISNGWSQYIVFFPRCSLKWEKMPRSIPTTGRFQKTQSLEINVSSQHLCIEQLKYLSTSIDRFFRQ